MAHALEIEALQDCDRLEQDRSLSPESRLEDFERAVPGLERAPRGLLHPALVACEVGLRHETACLANGLGDPLGDIAPIETVPRGIDGGLAPALPVPLLGLAERAQGAPEIVLAEDAPVGGDGASRALEVYACAAGEGQHPLELGSQVQSEGIVPGEAVRELDRRRERVGKRKGAKLSERDAERVDDRRDRSRGRPVRWDPPLASEDVDRGRRRRSSLAANDENLAPLGDVHDDWDFATQAEMGDLTDRGCERRRHAGIDRVPAPRQHSHAGLGGEMPSGSHDADATDDLGPVRGRAGDAVDRRRLAGDERQDQETEGDREHEVTNPGRHDHVTAETMPLAWRPRPLSGADAAHGQRVSPPTVWASTAPPRSRC